MDSFQSCLVENDDPDGDPSMENVTFLYTLVDGPSPKSYGFFTARMAGIKPEVGTLVSLRSAFLHLVDSTSVSGLQDCLSGHVSGVICVSTYFPILCQIV